MPHQNVARCRDSDNVSKVCAANVDRVAIYNVMDTPLVFSMQLPVVSEMQCTIPASPLVYCGKHFLLPLFCAYYGV